MAISYHKNNKSELAGLCDLYGSDKGEISSDNNPYNWPSHTYTNFYEMIFSHCRESVRSILECGLGTNNPNIPYSMGINGQPGASLRVWRDYFRNARIIGIDIDQDVLFSENRIDTYQVDQTCPVSIANCLESLDSELRFDIVIDDGLHECQAGICLFENIEKRLANSGIYIIEDVMSSLIPTYDDYFSRRNDRYYVRFVNLCRPGLALGGNSLIIITRK